MLYTWESAIILCLLLNHWYVYCLQESKREWCSCWTDVNGTCHDLCTSVHSLTVCITLIRLDVHTGILPFWFKYSLHILSSHFWYCIPAYLSTLHMRQSRYTFAVNTHWVNLAQWGKFEVLEKNGTLPLPLEVVCSVLRSRLWEMLPYPKQEPSRFKVNREYLLNVLQEVGF